MSKQIVSAFLASHGSIDAQFVSTRKDDKGVDIYEFEIGYQHLPANTRLYMPNILGKLYYANPLTTLTFIKGKIKEWNKHQYQRPAPAPAPDLTTKDRNRSRSPELTHSSFSDFIAEALTRFEEGEVAEMFKLMNQCDREDLPGYVQGHKMPILQKEQRRKLSKAAIQKTGIKWDNRDFYIPEKKCNLTNKPGEGILVVIEEIQSGERRTIVKNIETIDSIRGRKNIADIERELRSVLRLDATAEICFFDFACNTFNFLRASSEIDKYWPNLLAYQHNDDGGATIIHGTVLKDQCKQQRAAESLGENGVSFDDEPASQLYLPDSASQSDSLGGSQTSVASLPEKATPFLFVRVPEKAISLIDFGSSDVFKAGPAAATAAASVSEGVTASPDRKQGGKRKHTKRKRSIKRSYRKRRVTRRKYNSRRYNKNKK
jgi:hypothetical protein